MGSSGQPRGPGGILRHLCAGLRRLRRGQTPGRVFRGLRRRRILGVGADIAALRDVGVLVLADAKRGDIGSTMAAYAVAWAGDSPLAADAVTASPYLGFGSLRPLLETAAAHDRGVFVLAATSNPEGATVQHARFDDRTVAQQIVDQAAVINRTGQTINPGEPGSVGVVVGATVFQPPD